MRHSRDRGVVIFPKIDGLGIRAHLDSVVISGDQWWPEPQEVDLVIDDLSELIPGLFKRDSV